MIFILFFLTPKKFLDKFRILGIVRNPYKVPFFQEIIYHLAINHKKFNIFLHSQNLLEIIPLLGIVGNFLQKAFLHKIRLKSSISCKKFRIFVNLNIF